MIVGVILVSCFVAIFANSCDSDKYKKIGCFERLNSTLVTTIFTGESFDVETYNEKLPGLVCDCFNKTKDSYKYFAVGSLGHCYAGNDFSTSAVQSSDCTGPVEHHSGGLEDAEYIYQIKADAAAPVDGNATEFSEWTQCSKSCGGGKQSRERACVNPLPNDPGEGCDNLTEVRDCNTQECPVDGGWSSYGTYGSCSKTCGGGIKIKTRECDNPPPAHGGKNCDGSSEETASCNTQLCLGSWTCETKYTSFNDEGEGKVEYLDRHAPSCAQGTAMNYFKLQRSGSQYRYKYKCCSTQLPCTDKGKYTSFDNDGDSNPVYLDRHSVSCSNDNYMNYFKLERNSGHTQIRYKYYCCEMSYSKSCYDDKTTFTDDGDGFWDSRADARYLDRQTVSCNSGYGLTYFKLERDSGHENWRYKFRCCKTNQP